jgi:hypothetical protein
VLELPTGTGLALAAGLNAWIPLVILGVRDRFTGLVELPPDCRAAGIRHRRRERPKAGPLSGTGLRYRVCD